MAASTFTPTPIARVEQDRAADFILALIEHHSGREPSDVLVRLVQHNGQIARSEVLRALGHVPANPRAWLRERGGVCPRCASR